MNKTKSSASNKCKRYYLFTPPKIINNSQNYTKTTQMRELRLNMPSTNVMACKFISLQLRITGILSACLIPEKLNISLTDSLRKEPSKWSLEESYSQSILMTAEPIYQIKVLKLPWKLICLWSWLNFQEMQPERTFTTLQIYSLSEST